MHSSFWITCARKDRKARLGRKSVAEFLNGTGHTLNLLPLLQN